MPQSQQEPLVSASLTGAVPRVPPPWAMTGGCPTKQPPLLHAPRECAGGAAGAVVAAAPSASLSEAHAAPNHALPAAGCHRYPLFFLCPNSSFI